MILKLHKSKYYLLITLKVLILGLTSTYIYVKLSDHTSPELISFVEKHRIFNADSLLLLFLFLGLTTANWFFEILKWKTVMSNLRSISRRSP